MSGALAAVTAAVATVGVVLLGRTHPRTGPWRPPATSARCTAGARPARRLRVFSPPARLSQSRWGDRPSTTETQQVALAADLVVAALDAGAPLRSALRAVAEALGGDVGAALDAALRRLDLGADAASAVETPAMAEPMARLARAVARAAQTGMPPAQVLRGVAERERASITSARLSRARAAGSLAAVPLGLLVLPAFVLVAVVPTVIGALSSVLGVR